MAATDTSHDESTRRYWIIGGILAAITIVEVIIAWPGLFYSPESVDFTTQLIVVPILLLLSVLKGTMVVMFFMHLKGDAGVFKFLFIVPLVIATSMLTTFLVLFSGHVGIAG
jgi:cytochrome c oxidase subunit IV